MTLSKRILFAWLIVGTLDITAATIHFLLNGGKDPLVIFNYIASGILGPKAYEIGAPLMTILGLALHYLIALGWTLIFFTLYPRLPIMARNRVVTGIVYGYIMQIIMTQFVVRVISKITPRPFNLNSFLISGGILVVAIGIPLSFMAYRHFYGKKST
jgi:hypothetical protein